MAYDFGNEYIPPPRGYLQKAPQAAYAQPTHGQEVEQSGFRSVATAHEDYLQDQDHGIQSRFVADKVAQTSRGRPGRDDSRRRDPSRPGETREAMTQKTQADEAKEPASLCLIHHHPQQWPRTTPFPSFLPSALLLLLPPRNLQGRRAIHPDPAIHPGLGKVMASRAHLPPMQTRMRPGRATTSPNVYKHHPPLVQDLRPPTMLHVLHRIRALKICRTPYRTSAHRTRPIQSHKSVHKMLLDPHHPILKTRDPPDMMPLRKIRDMPGRMPLRKT